MIRRPLESILEMAKSLVDDTVPQEDLYAYIERGLQRLNESLQERKLSGAEPRVWEIKHSAQKLRGLGVATLPMIAAVDIVPHDHKPEPGPSIAQAVLNHGTIAFESVTALLQMVDRGGAISEAVDKEVESLLRHLEVRRKTGLEFTPTLQGHAKWRAVTSISLLFNRFARHKGDLRFLNAALKINDWTYRYYRKRTEFPLDFLCALLEAEVLLREMTA